MQVLFNHDVPADKRIVGIYYLFDNALRNRFESQLSANDSVAESLPLASKIEEGPFVSERQRILCRWQEMTDSFCSSQREVAGRVQQVACVKVLPLWQCKQKKNIRLVKGIISRIALAVQLPATRARCNYPG